MVSFVIVDDDINIRSTVRSIIKQYKLGAVLAECEDGAEAEQTLCEYQPEIALVDLLLPIQDGIKLIKKVRSECPDTTFIMISQANSEPLVTQAFQSGIEFYIHKPINVLEFVSVISKVMDYRKLKQTLSFISQTAARSHNYSLNTYNEDAGNMEKRITVIFSEIGIIGVVGTKDIIKIVLIVDHYLNQDNNADYHLNEIFQQLSLQLKQDAKAIEQRVRRAIYKALENVAGQGLEDFYNDKFQKYNSTLFEFKEVRMEMDYLNGKGKYHGKINIKKFVEGIIFIAKQAGEA